MESFFEEGQNHGFDSSFKNISIKSVLVSCVLILGAYFESWVNTPLTSSSYHLKYFEKKSIS